MYYNIIGVILNYPMRLFVDQYRIILYTNEEVYICFIYKNVVLNN